MKTVCFSEMLAYTNESTQCQNPEEQHHPPHCRENLKFHSNGFIVKLKVSDMNESRWYGEREFYTNSICFTLEITEYFIHHLSEADWLTRACDSRCTEASKTQPPSFMLVTLVK
jgi:hypothetical protein